jgi:hypothetical protein
MSLRLGDHLFRSPNGVVDQSLLAIRPAISFFVEGAVSGRFATLSSNDILVSSYGTGGKQPNAHHMTALDKGRALRTRKGSPAGTPSRGRDRGTAASRAAKMTMFRLVLARAGGESLFLRCKSVVGTLEKFRHSRV